MTGARPDHDRTTGDATGAASGTVTTPRVAAARGSITQVPVTPGESALSRLGDRLRGVSRGERTPAREPLPGPSAIRLILAVILAVLCVLTAGGAVLLLLLWQQSRESGVLTTQLDRTWDLLDTLQSIERIVAFAAVPVAVAWIAMAALNVGRSTGTHRNPVVAAISLPIGIAAVWFIGDQLVAGSDDTITRVGGWVLQIALLALPVIFLERIALAADARRRPIRATYLIAAAYLGQLQFLGGLSTIERDDATNHWGQLGAYVLIGALMQVIGALSANEAGRSIEDGTQHRFELRSRFSESLLAQASM